MGEGCFRSMDTLSEGALLKRMSLSPIGINHIEIVMFRESGTLPSEVNLLSRGLALFSHRGLSWFKSPLPENSRKLSRALVTERDAIWNRLAILVLFQGAVMADCGLKEAKVRLDTIAITATCAQG